jgi:hypothetical protein
MLYSFDFLGNLTLLGSKTSLPPPSRTTPKLALFFSRVWPSESTSSKTRFDTVGLSRLKLLDQDKGFIPIFPLPSRYGNLLDEVP